MLMVEADFFTKNVDRTWRLLENLEAGMIGMNTGNQSAAESPFGGIKESGYGKESGKDVAVAEVSFALRFPWCDHSQLTLRAVHDHQDWHAHAGRPLLVERGRGAGTCTFVSSSKDFVSQNTLPRQCTCPCCAACTRKVSLLTSLLSFIRLFCRVSLIKNYR